MLEIWGRRNSLNVQKVMWAVGEMGLDYVRHDVAGSFGKTDTAEYIAMNPNRIVPVIVDDGFVLWESNACVRYLAAKHGSGSLYPTDSRACALADQWMTWLNTTLSPAMMIPFVALLRTPAEERNQTALEESAAKLGDLFQLLNDHLANHRFVVGDEFTMGDIPLGCATWRFYHMEIERPTLPNVETWYARLLERPAYQQHVAFPFGTTPAEWTALEQAGVGK